VYKSYSGWQTSTEGAKSWEDLPVAARDYIEKIGEELEAKVRLVSVGPDRNQTIVL
jgi:adenylosuccinate synthase